MVAEIADTEQNDAALAEWERRSDEWAMGAGQMPPNEPVAPEA